MKQLVEGGGHGKGGIWRMEAEVGLEKQGEGGLVVVQDERDRTQLSQLIDAALKLAWV
jgi:hypothetical protein